MQFSFQDCCTHTVATYLIQGNVKDWCNEIIECIMLQNFPIMFFGISPIFYLLHLFYTFRNAVCFFVQRNSSYVNVDVLLQLQHTNIGLGNTMADLGWGIWGKCSPPSISHLVSGTFLIKIATNFMPSQEIHEHTHILLQIHLNQSEPNSN